MPRPRSTWRLHRIRALMPCLLLIFFLAVFPLGRLHAQFSSLPVELSSSVNLDEADSTVRAHLERVKAYLADEQWDEAVETLREVMENHGGKVIGLTRSRFVNLAEYCQVQIAGLPAPALALYRDRVDALAQQWYEEAAEQRSTAKLQELLNKMFCSLSGDDALWLLGELELEQAHYGAARRAWERLLELPPARIAAAEFQAVRQSKDLPAAQAALLDQWYQPDTADAPRVYQLRQGEPLPESANAALIAFWRQWRVAATRLAYPGGSFSPADVRARLILTSIMEGSLSRARQELQAFEKLHPGAVGHLAGRQVNLAETLAGLITAAASWPEPRPARDWLTFAGSYARTKIVPRQLDLGPVAWPPINLGEALTADAGVSRAYSLRRTGEDSQALLGYHPLIVGDLLLVNNHSQIFAFNLRTGAAAWPSSDPKRPVGEIYFDEAAAQARMPLRGWGVPRFTMTVHENKLYARMGNQVTTRPLEMSEREAGTIVCLDLAAQGRLVWRLSPNEGRAEDDRWAFEGSPIVSGADVYVALRKSDVRPQSHVACYDRQNKRMRWRTMICAAETPGGGQLEELSHNLLTLADGSLYYNTNLGVVAALDANDGRLQWAALYPRAKKARPDGQDRGTARYYRDLNPCIYYRGAVLAAPSDCDSIFALDAGSGELLWETRLAEDAVALLGVGQDYLLASGDTLWWIDVQRGQVAKHWPDTTPRGHGRGILMGDEVIWPTMGELFVLDQDARSSRAARDPIPLGPRGQAVGGNLVAADQALVIAAASLMYGFQQQGPSTESPPAGATGNTLIPAQRAAPVGGPSLIK